MSCSMFGGCMQVDSKGGLRTDISSTGHIGSKAQEYWTAKTSAEQAMDEKVVFFPEQFFLAQMLYL